MSAWGARLGRLRRRASVARAILGSRARVALRGREVRGEDPVAANIVWVFGTIRSGSTWLGSMLGDLGGHELWNEPRIGEMFGHFFYERASHRRENENFILSERYRKSWLGSIRSFVLDAVGARYPWLSGGGRLVIKEPSGSIGAPLLAEALPESGLILLVRDPRDVVASALDAAGESGWTRRLSGRRRREQERSRREREGMPVGPARDAIPPRNRQVRRRAAMYLQYVGNSRRAYENHPGPKVLVRYEDLRADTLDTMLRICSALNIASDKEELRRVVERHSWENIPEEEKGEGKFYRRGIAGGWREDLTPKQAQIVEEITAPLLKEFYPG